MRYGTLDLNLMKLLDVLLREKSVTATAKHLHMTQSGVSNALTRLRDHFGDALLMRVGNSMKLTPAAIAMQPDLADILHKINDFCSPLDFDPANSKRTITLLIEEYIPPELMAAFVDRVGKISPELSLRILKCRNDAKDRLVRGAADMVIGSGRVTVSGLPRTPLYQDQFVCLTSPQFPFDSNPVDGEDYLARPHAKLFHGDANTDLFQSLGINRKVRVEVATLGMLFEVVKNTDCVATSLSSAVPSLLASAELLAFDPPFTLPVLSIGVQWHHRAKKDLLLQWLTEILVEVSNSIFPAGKGKFS